jgi:hypothetical protein
LKNSKTDWLIKLEKSSVLSNPVYMTDHWSTISLKYCFQLRNTTIKVKSMGMIGWEKNKSSLMRTVMVVVGMISQMKEWKKIE